MKPQEVLNNIVSIIESGVKPWERPWSTSSGSIMPINYATKREYTGFNILNFWNEQAVFGYKTCQWIGFNQARQLGLYVMKGEKGHYGLRMNSINLKDKDGNKTDEFINLPTSFCVFNVDQLNGFEHEDEVKKEWNSINDADVLINDSGAVIEYGGDRACYNKTNDVIRLPVKEAFKNAEGFYATALHELSHWTGHESRLNRTFGKRFGDHAYAIEELVAEMSCAFIMAHIGLHGEIENHAGYLNHWITALKQNPKILLTASSEASKAYNFIIGGNNEY